MFTSESMRVLKFEYIASESREKTYSTISSKRICFSYDQSVSIIFKFLISVVNGRRNENGGNSHVEI
jgi:hypothetical protein